MTKRQFAGNWEVLIAANGDWKSFLESTRGKSQVKGVVMSKWEVHIGNDCRDGSVTNNKVTSHRDLVLPTWKTNEIWVTLQSTLHLYSHTVADLIKEQGYHTSQNSWHFPLVILLFVALQSLQSLSICTSHFDITTPLTLSPNCSHSTLPLYRF